MDIAIVLVIVLVIVLIWRGPKTLPSLGKAFGQGVKEARKEIEEIKTDTAATGDDAVSPAQPPAASSTPPSPPPPPAT